jgi:hypothetical protein
MAMTRNDIQNPEAWAKAMLDTGLQMDLAQWQAWCMPYVEKNRWHPCPRTYRGWIKRLAKMASWHAKQDKKRCIVYEFPGLAAMHYRRLWVPVEMDVAAIPVYYKRQWREAEDISEAEYRETKKERQYGRVATTDADNGFS